MGLALVLPAIGGGDALARAAHDLPPPRIQALRRTSLLILLFTLLGTTASVYLFVRLVPAGEQSLWLQAPLAGLAQHVGGPPWVADLLALALLAAAVVAARASRTGRSG